MSNWSFSSTVKEWDGKRILKEAGEEEALLVKINVKDDAKWYAKRSFIEKAKRLGVKFAGINPGYPYLRDGRILHLQTSSKWAKIEGWSRPKDSNHGGSPEHLLKLVRELEQETFKTKVSAWGEVKEAKESKRSGPRYTERGGEEFVYLGQYENYDVYWIVEGKAGYAYLRYGHGIYEYVTRLVPSAYAGPVDFGAVYVAALKLAEEKGLYDPDANGWTKAIYCDCGHSWEEHVPYTRDSEIFECPVCGKACGL